MPRNCVTGFFLTLASLAQQDKIQLTIVDGFCGSGFYNDEAGADIL
jgi:hypothetical protein